MLEWGKQDESLWYPAATGVELADPEGEENALGEARIILPSCTTRFPPLPKLPPKHDGTTDGEAWETTTDAAAGLCETGLWGEMAVCCRRVQGGRGSEGAGIGGEGVPV